MFRLKGSGIKTRLLNPVDEFWDRRIGVRTFGFKPAVGADGAPDYRIHYEPTPYRKIFRVLNEVGLGKEDSFLDIGSGMGRVVFAASWLGARRAVGVEIDEELSGVAEDNRRTSRLKTREIAFECRPAQDYRPEGVTVIYMFHPFGPGTMRAVLDNLRGTLEDDPRTVRIIYENPVCADVIDETGLFRRSGIWPATGRRDQPYDTVFWESV